MAVTPESPIAKSLEVLRTYLSNVTRFQKLVQATTAAAALSSIHMFGYRGEPGRPFALVNDEDHRSEDIAGGNRIDYTDKPQLGLMIEIPLEWSALVTTANSTTVFRLSSCVNLRDDFFNGLKARLVRTNAPVGDDKDVLDFTGSNGEVTLSSGFSSAPIVGDTIKIYPSIDADAYMFARNELDQIYYGLLEKSGTEVSVTSLGVNSSIALRNARREFFVRSARESEQYDYCAAGWLFDVFN